MPRSLFGTVSAQDIFVGWVVWIIILTQTQPLSCQHLVKRKARCLFFLGLITVYRYCCLLYACLAHFEGPININWWTRNSGVWLQPDPRTIFLRKFIRAGECRILCCESWDFWDPLLLLPNPKPGRNGWGEKGSTSNYIFGYIITRSGSHWWWVLKELWVLSILKCFVFSGFAWFVILAPSPSAFQGNLLSRLDKTEMQDLLMVEQQDLNVLNPQPPKPLSLWKYSSWKDIIRHKIEVLFISFPNRWPQHHLGSFWKGRFLSSSPELQHRVGPNHVKHLHKPSSGFWRVFRFGNPCSRF